MDNSSTADQPAPERLHDLDALRGFAMLLGIVLHAALAFIPGAWLVTDDRADSNLLIDELVDAIHGFRMPLFFLISGFFTTMLWRRRGTIALARHRTLRVLLPLVIGAVTILPLMDAISDGARTDVDLLTAVVDGDAERVDELAARGEVITTPDEGGTTLLHIAAFLGHNDVVDVLIAYGADVNATETTGGSPVASAVAAGQADTAEQLVAAGATDLRETGQDWTDLDIWRIAAFDDRAHEAVLGIESLDHLWFLWYLVILVAGFLAVAIAADRIHQWRGSTPRLGDALMWNLIPLSLGAHNVMADQLGLQFGAATSTSIRPDWIIIAYYATFFAFGALLWGRTGSDGRPMVRTVGLGWSITLGAALIVALPVGLTLTDNAETGFATFLAVTVQGAYTWLMIFGLIGLFHHILGTERPAVRYLSDSSYWLYLAHLPLVFDLQGQTADWDINPYLKFAGLITVSTVTLLVSYALLVRPTPIGQLLNGRRHPLLPSSVRSSATRGLASSAVRTGNRPARQLGNDATSASSGER